MNSNKKYIRVLIITGLFLSSLITGCMDNLTGTDNIFPTVNVYRPVTNDTIDVGTHEIIYDANDDQGLRNIELYVNDIFKNSFAMNSNGTKPAVYWNVDSSMVN
ncbi:MAG: hypothetical protein Q8Q47_09875, partial [Ignavibacteriaceae bacterium]|nr:hypothetical protein [Ignavibacteriaceae bacterium]